MRLSSSVDNSVGHIFWMDGEGELRKRGYGFLENISMDALRNPAWQA